MITRLVALLLLLQPVTSSTMDQLRLLENDEDCPLECENGATCVSTNTFLHKVNQPSIGISGPPFRCICQPGFQGINCEDKAESCGEPGRFCQYGAPCVTTKNAEGKDQQVCDCALAFPESNFAGDTCEYAATMNCEIEVDEVGEGGTDFSAVATRAFCVNDGKCVKLVEPGKAHRGCDCPTGFEGSFCEFSFEPAFGSALFEKSPASPFVTELIVGCVIALLSITAIYAIVVVRRFFRFRDAERQMMVSALNATDELQMAVEDSSHGEFVIDDEDETSGRKSKGNKYSSVSRSNNDIPAGEII
uniref:EGF-like domain-containing protein n=1 Tax=Helicotheca tamesis TaxID=374047 RepID=A0A7S2HSG2_9STRA